jgi:hypothetical protein
MHNPVFCPALPGDVEHLYMVFPDTLYISALSQSLLTQFLSAKQLALSLMINIDKFHTLSVVRWYLSSAIYQIQQAQGKNKSFVNGKTPFRLKAKLIIS